MLKITMRTDTAAMKEGPEWEVGRLLREIAQETEDYRREGVIWDANGVKIGEWSWTEKGE